MSDAFAVARERLNMWEVTRFYGFSPSRAGFICCPFHGEKTASLKIYPGVKGWHCFGCHRGGSVIDFVAQLYGLSPLEALRKLDRDFALHLQLKKSPETPVENLERQHRQEITKAHRAFELWRKVFVELLCTAVRIGNTVTASSWDELTEAQLAALRYRPQLEYWLDCLQFGTAEDQAGIYQERGKILGCLSQILND